MKSMIKLISVLAFLLGFNAATSQNPVLFEVEGEPVYLDEFMYIYEKTNRDEADFSRASVEEYLTLYENFKLKVQKARDLKFDTIDALNTELAGYRKQLADTYLSDQDVVESLVKEAYERMQKDVSFSHILFKVAPSATPDEDKEIYAKALATLDRLRADEEFTQVAREMSDDPTVAKNGGKIGFVTAMLPDGFYDLETALYTLPLKTYSRPIRTKLGYHIARVDARRNARGEMEVSHILLRDAPEARERINEIYQQILDGEDFATLAGKFSEDRATAAKGGYLGFFGINKYESGFENTAFRLHNDGDVSKPVQSSIGWHIIKRLSAKPLPPFESVKRTLETKIKNDSRFEVAEDAMVEKIKDDNGYEDLDWNKKLLLEELGRDVMSYQWKVPSEYTNQALFKIGDSTVDVQAFTAYLTKNTAARLRLDRTMPPGQSIDVMFEDFVEDQLKIYEETQLEQKYPEFKALMREYSEGILLFEVTKKYVWDRASQDSVGLKKYYQEHADEYRWPEKALVETITIASQDESTVEKVVAQLKKRPTQALLKKLNQEDELIRVQGQLIEEDELDPDLKWKKYALSKPYQSEEEAVTEVKRVAEIIPSERKTLDEARGYIIADYQDYLEKKWISDLREEYDVKVNQDVLASIIKA